MKSLNFSHLHLKATPPPPAFGEGRFIKYHRVLKLISFTVISSLGITANAQQYTASFDFTTLIDNSANQSINSTDNSVRLTITTNSDWNSDGNAGINTGNDGLNFQGTSSANPNRLSLQMQFDKAISLQTFTQSNYVFSNPGDYIKISFGSNTQDLIVYGLANQQHNFPTTISNWVVPENTPITFEENIGSFTTYNSWSQLQVTVIPEPATFTLVLGSLAGTLLYVKRRRSLSTS